MDDQVFRQITRVRDYFSDTKHYYQLLQHATSEASLYRWFSSQSRSMPRGNLAEDVVNDLIQQVLEEDPLSPTRRKIPDHVEVGLALRQHLRSKFSALSRSKENRTLQRETDLANDRDEDDSRDSPLEYTVPLWGQTDEDDDEHKTAVLIRIDRFLDFIADDHLLCAMINLARDENLYKPDEVIARRLDVSVNDIYIAKKRLKSARRRFAKSEQNKP